MKAGWLCQKWDLGKSVFSWGSELWHPASTRGPSSERSHRADVSLLCHWKRAINAVCLISGHPSRSGRARLLTSVCMLNNTWITGYSFESEKTDIWDKQNLLNARWNVKQAYYLVFQRLEDFFRKARRALFPHCHAKGNAGCKKMRVHFLMADGSQIRGSEASSTALVPGWHKETTCLHFRVLTPFQFSIIFQSFMISYLKTFYRHHIDD